VVQASGRALRDDSREALSEAELVSLLERTLEAGQ
jgi:hypothetical protein